MTFRPATLADTDTLYRWRLEAEDEAAAGGWWQGQPTTVDRHLHWLIDRVTNRLVQVLIWEEKGKPVGMVRIDSNGELAYHVPAEHRGRGVEQRMLAAAVKHTDMYGGRLKAVIDEDDVERTNVLLAAGFRKYPAVFLAHKP